MCDQRAITCTCICTIHIPSRHYVLKIKITSSLLLIALVNCSQFAKKMANKRKITGAITSPTGNNKNNNNTQMSPQSNILRESQELNIVGEKRKRISNSPCQDESQYQSQAVYEKKRFSSAPNDLVSMLNDLNDLETVIWKKS